MWRTEHGDRTAVDNEILRTVVGSEVHGIGIAGTDDHDEMGVYIETPETVLSVREAKGHYTARTQPEGQRSRHGDTDLTLYSLRRFLALAMTGHPTVLLPLFAPNKDVLFENTLGFELRKLGPSLLSQQAGRRFLGYMEGQIRRVEGQDKRHVPNRPELIAAHGYDTKYAAHALRLAMQGVEVVRDGTLTLPMPARWRELVLAVKSGGIDKQGALYLIGEWADTLRRLLESETSPLPYKPDIDKINEWSVQAHFSHWEDQK
jgi:uncharacterized protein